MAENLEGQTATRPTGNPSGQPETPPKPAPEAETPELVKKPEPQKPKETPPKAEKKKPEEVIDAEALREEREKIAKEEAKKEVEKRAKEKTKGEIEEAAKGKAEKIKAVKTKETPQAELAKDIPTDPEFVAKNPHLIYVLAEVVSAPESQYKNERWVKERMGELSSLVTEENREVVVEVLKEIIHRPEMAAMFNAYEVQEALGSLTQEVLGYYWGQVPPEAPEASVFDTLDERIARLPDRDRLRRIISGVVTVREKTPSIFNTPHYLEGLVKQLGEAYQEADPESRAFLDEALVELNSTMGKIEQQARRRETLREVISPGEIREIVERGEAAVKRMAYQMLSEAMANPEAHFNWNLYIHETKLEYIFTVWERSITQNPNLSEVDERRQLESLKQTKDSLHGKIEEYKEGVHELIKYAIYSGETDPEKIMGGVLGGRLKTSTLNLLVSKEITPYSPLSIQLFDELVRDRIAQSIFRFKELDAKLARGETLSDQERHQLEEAIFMFTKDILPEEGQRLSPLEQQLSSLLERQFEMEIEARLRVENPAISEDEVREKVEKEKFKDKYKIDIAIINARAFHFNTLRTIVNGANLSYISDRISVAERLKAPIFEFLGRVVNPVDIAWKRFEIFFREPNKYLIYSLLNYHLEEVGATLGLPINETVVDGRPLKDWWQEALNKEDIYEREKKMTKTLQRALGFSVPSLIRGYIFQTGGLTDGSYWRMEEALKHFWEKKIRPLTGRETPETEDDIDYLRQFNLSYRLHLVGGEVDADIHAGRFQMLRVGEIDGSQVIYQLRKTLKEKGLSKKSAQAERELRNILGKLRDFADNEAECRVFLKGEGDWDKDKVKKEVRALVKKEIGVLRKEEILNLLAERNPATIVSLFPEEVKNLIGDGWEEDWQRIKQPLLLAQSEMVNNAVRDSAEIINIFRTQLANFGITNPEDQNRYLQRLDRLRNFFRENPLFRQNIARHPRLPMAFSLSDVAWEATDWGEVSQDAITRRYKGDFGLMVKVYKTIGDYTTNISHFEPVAEKVFPLVKEVTYPLESYWGREQAVKVGEFMVKAFDDFARIKIPPALEKFGLKGRTADKVFAMIPGIGLLREIGFLRKRLPPSKAIELGKTKYAYMYNPGDRRMFDEALRVTEAFFEEEHIYEQLGKLMGTEYLDIVQYYLFRGLLLLATLSLVAAFKESIEEKK